jgi:Protein of unknown function (DUF3037)
VSDVYQFVVVRYVPDVVRNEGVNVGVLVRSIEGVPFDFKFLPRSATVKKLLPSADGRLVRHFETQLKAARNEEKPLSGLGYPGNPEFLDAMQNEFTGNLQVTAPRAVVAQGLPAALSLLYRQMVEEAPANARPINYQSLAPFQTRERLWSAFEKRELVRPNGVHKALPISGKHAPWTFDLSYKNGGIHVISSLALDAATEVNLSRALVLKGMAEEVSATLGEQGSTTAVIKSKSDGASIGLPDALSILDDAGINIVPFNKVGELVSMVASRLH